MKADFNLLDTFHTRCILTTLSTRNIFGWIQLSTMDDVKYTHSSEHKGTTEYKYILIKFRYSPTARNYYAKLEN
jgi:hypothetical protein